MHDCVYLIVYLASKEACKNRGEYWRRHFRSYSGPHMVTSMILLHVQRIIDVVEAVRSIDNVAIATLINRVNSAVCVSEARDAKF